MKLKNDRSDAALSTIFAEIEKTLAAHGAKQITREYDRGQVIAITFDVQSNVGLLMVRLPARFDRVEQLFKQQGIQYKPDQPYCTAWEKICNWLKAQMAFLDWEMVKLEEVFLPYVTHSDGKSFFEVMEERQFRLQDQTT